MTQQTPRYELPRLPLPLNNNNNRKTKTMESLIQDPYQQQQDQNKVSALLPPILTGTRNKNSNNNKINTINHSYNISSDLQNHNNNNNNNNNSNHSDLIAMMMSTKQQQQRKPSSKPTSTSRTKSSSSQKKTTGAKVFDDHLRAAAMMETIEKSLLENQFTPRQQQQQQQQQVSSRTKIAPKPPQSQQRTASSHQAEKQKILITTTTTSYSSAPVPPTSAASSVISDPSTTASSSSVILLQQQQQQQREDDLKQKVTSTATTTAALTSRIPVPPPSKTKQQQQQQQQQYQSTNIHHNNHYYSRAVSPSTAIREFQDVLTGFEVDEIKKYKNIYFCGQDRSRKIQSGNYTEPTDCKNSCDYKIVVGDHIAYRFELVSRLGSGSFGQVCKALDHKTGHHVAIKLIKNKKKFHDQAVIEKNILEFVNKNFNSTKEQQEELFIRLRDAFIFRNHVCMIFDLHGSSLYDRMKATQFAPTPLAVVQKYAAQLLRAHDAMAKAHLVHTDIKPENVLIAKRSSSSSSSSNDGLPSIRLIDFGSACFEHQRIHSYVQSRFYRAPEVVLGIPYCPKVDLWSIACVLYELHTGQPLFPAQSENELLSMIHSRIGPCPLHLLDKAPRRKHHYDSEGKLLVKSKQQQQSKGFKLNTLSSLFASSESELADLLGKMLRWDSKDRISVADALSHPFFKKEFAKPGASYASAGGASHYPPSSGRTIKKKYSFSGVA